MPDPGAARQVGPGERVVLLTGAYLPPTMCYFRALEVLTGGNGGAHVWLCPFRSGDHEDATHAVNMATCLAAEIGNDF